MQFSIYIVLGVCLVCLLLSIATFFLFERRWQERIEHDAQMVMRRGRYKDSVREDTVSPRQWQELRHRFDEMQIVADETLAVPHKQAA